MKFSKSPLAGLADVARLRRQLQSGGLSVLAAVDTTRNNTSIVMRLTHGSARLLLVGDAEEMSWEIMRKNGAPLKADVIKVGHHGSINSSPDWSFTAVMPKKLASNAAVISTDDDRFTGENEVPKDTVLNGWRGRLKKPVAAAAHGLECESGRICGGDARGLRSPDSGGRLQAAQACSCRSATAVY